MKIDMYYNVKEIKNVAKILEAFSKSCKIIRLVQRGKILLSTVRLVDKNNQADLVLLFEIN